MQKNNTIRRHNDAKAAPYRFRRCYGTIQRLLENRRRPVPEEFAYTSEAYWKTFVTREGFSLGMYLEYTIRVQ